MKKKRFIIASLALVIIAITLVVFSFCLSEDVIHRLSESAALFVGIATPFLSLASLYALYAVQRAIINGPSKEQVRHEKKIMKQNKNDPYGFRVKLNPQEDIITSYNRLTSTVKDLIKMIDDGVDNGANFGFEISELVFCNI